MSEQHFHQPVTNVAGGNIIQNNYSLAEERCSGPQKWVAKHYIAGKHITSGWLTFFAFLALVTIAISQLYYIFSQMFYHQLQTHQPPHLLIRCCLFFGFVIVAGLIEHLLMDVSECGFAGIPHTQIGIARDINRHVFIARLGGEGSLCPNCKVKLHFSVLGRSPILRCKHNGNHWSPFDFTEVKD